MSTPTDKLTERVAHATERLAQLKARQLLQQMRADHRIKANKRRHLQRRRLALGDAVIDAGLESWPAVEILGLLLHALDDGGDSPTVRLGLRKRAEARRTPATAGVPEEKGAA